MRRALVLLALVACKKSDDAPKAAPADAARAIARIDAAPVAAAPSPDAAPAGPHVLAPDDVTDAPVTVEQLFTAAQTWGAGTAVRVGGYPVFYLGDEDTLGTQVKLAASPGAKDADAIVVCAMTQADTNKVKNTTPVVLAGKVDQLGPPVSLSQCTLISIGTGFDASAPALPGGDTTVPASALAKVTSGWLGKTISVTGVFGSVTVSKDPKTQQVIDVRIDVLTAVGNFERKVGCHLAAPPDDATQAAWSQKAGAPFTVKGTFAENVFGAPQLEPCAITP